MDKYININLSLVLHFIISIIILDDSFDNFI